MEAFKYLTPKIRLDQHSLTKEMLRSKSFHLICSPSRCVELAQGYVSLFITQHSEAICSLPFMVNL